MVTFFWLCQTAKYKKFSLFMKNPEVKEAASVKAWLPLALEGEDGEERMTGFFRLLLGL